MTSRKANRLLELAKEIIRLEQELAARRTEFRRLSGDDDVFGARHGEEAEPQDEQQYRREATFMDRVQSVLDRSARPMNAHEIAAQLEQPESIDTVRATLSKLIQAGSVARVTVGVYRSTVSGHRTGATDDD